MTTLSPVAQSAGPDEEELRMLRAVDAASHGRPDQVLSLTDHLLTSGSPRVRSQAALLAAAVHLQGNRLERAAALYRHVGAMDMGADGAWAVLAALGRGDLETAKIWRSAMGDVGLTSYAAGLSHLADGLLCSLDGAGDGALDLLARAVAELAPVGSQLLLPESPAALAGLVAISRGEPAAAQLLLDRALRSNLGGDACRSRHLLIVAWSLMARGHLDDAERRLDGLGAAHELSDRDLLLFWCLRAGIARRRGDMTNLRTSWRELRSHLLGLSLNLYDLLPLGEMMIVAARLGDYDHLAPYVEEALDLLATLGQPAVWAAPLHWCGVQAAFHTENPAALLPHADALVTIARVSPYAATLAEAGRTWLQVLRDEADQDCVENSVRALAETGHAWDAARLAGLAALRQRDRDDQHAMLQLARQVSQTTRPLLESSVLTTRELDVARLVVAGHGYRAIGERLFISPKTVEHHVARMRRRLGASSREELLSMLRSAIAGDG